MPPPTFSSALLWKYLAFPTLLCVCMIALARLYIQPNKTLRKQVTSNRLWKAQFLCHPLIMATVVLASSLNASSPDENDKRSVVILSYATLSVAFAFNFGVEPYDLPNDLVFAMCFYAHHYAVVLASAMMLSFAASDDIKYSFGTHQALLLGHAWMLHPISYFDTKKMIDKQAIFAPYMTTGLLCMVFYWSDHAVIPLAYRLPVALQYVGRWGLYLRLCFMTGIHKPDNPQYDPFEWRKQYFELGSFGLAFLVAKMVWS